MYRLSPFCGGGVGGCAHPSKFSYRLNRYDDFSIKGLTLEFNQCYKDNSSAHQMTLTPRIMEIMESRTIEPIKNIQLPEATISHLTKMISEGYWKPGEKLPSQRDLAVQLGIGVSSLREALQSLQAMGILEMRHGEGTYVTPEPYHAIQRLLSLSMSLVDLDIKSLFDARLVLESGLAYFAAVRASDEQIDELFANLELQKKALLQGRMTDIDDLDISFHVLVAEMANSEFLKQVDVPLYHALEHLLRNIHHTEDGLNRHIKVAEAIRDRDPEKSYAVMRVLIEKAAAVYVQLW